MFKQTFSKETSSTTFKSYSSFIRRFISNWSFNASNTVHGCACLYRYLQAYSLYNGGRGVWFSGSQFMAVHVRAWTYMNAAHGQVYIYRYIYAYGRSLVIHILTNIHISFMNYIIQKHTWSKECKLLSCDHILKRTYWLQLIHCSVEITIFMLQVQRFHMNRSSLHSFTNIIHCSLGITIFNNIHYLDKVHLQWDLYFYGVLRCLCCSSHVHSHHVNRFLKSYKEQFICCSKVSDCCCVHYFTVHVLPYFCYLGWTAATEQTSNTQRPRCRCQLSSEVDICSVLLNF